MTGLIAIKYYSRVKEHSEDLLYLFSIPALFPVFVFGIGIPAGFFLKSCCVIQHYSQTEHIILLVSRIVYWLFLLFIAWYVSVKLSRRYVLVFLLEYLIFLAYLAAFYAKLVGPVKLPLHIFC
ncbi:MAG: hypothetical protein NTU98_03160 [Bacteroidetes bacterium]|nr:hypothetical protein [Bacteroidota bacterium]